MTRRAMWLLACSLLPLFTLSAPAGAQGGAPVEFGADAALGVVFDPNVVVLTVPVSDVRIGFAVSPKVELEPRLRLVAASGSGGSSTQVGLILGVLYHFSPSLAAPQTYIRPFADVSRFSGSGGFASTAVSLGVGVGLKRPIGNRFAFRPELLYSHQLDVDNSGSYNSLRLLVGFSVYSH